MAEFEAQPWEVQVGDLVLDPSEKFYGGGVWREVKEIMGSIATGREVRYGRSKYDSFPLTQPVLVRRNVKQEGEKS